MRCSISTQDDKRERPHATHLQPNTLWISSMNAGRTRRPDRSPTRSNALPLPPVPPPCVFGLPTSPRAAGLPSEDSRRPCTHRRRVRRPSRRA
eukprot:3100129-Prymnesium_polylepis.1